jgi:hypothetical protein
MTDLLKSRENQISELQGRLVMVQSERDFYRMRLADLDPEAGPSVSEASTNDASSDVKEVNSVNNGESSIVERDSLQIIAGYIKEIQMLKAELSASNAVQNRFSRSQTLDTAKYSDAQIFANLDEASASITEELDNMRISNDEIEESSIAESVTK